MIIKLSPKGGGNEKKLNKFDKMQIVYSKYPQHLFKVLNNNKNMFVCDRVQHFKNI